jgi:hypothetical protein
MITDTPDWVFEEMNKWMILFFWAGKDKINGGQCLVVWDKICRPKRLGGLGIKSMKAQSLALRVRWEWLRRTDPRQPWQGLPMIEDTNARAIFNTMVSITMGKGENIMFWRDKWIHGFSVADIALLLVAMVQTRVVNSCTVQLALADDRWMQDCDVSVSFTAQLQCMHLCHAINTVQRDTTEPGRFIWPASATASYMAKSVYDYVCSSLLRSPTAACNWRSWAPLKCKLFVWLAL